MAAHIHKHELVAEHYFVSRMCMGAQDISSSRLFFDQNYYLRQVRSPQAELPAATLRAGGFAILDDLQERNGRIKRQRGARILECLLWQWRQALSFAFSF